MPAKESARVLNLQRDTLLSDDNVYDEHYICEYGRCNVCKGMTASEMGKKSATVRGKRGKMRIKGLEHTRREYKDKS